MYGGYELTIDQWVRWKLRNVGCAHTYAHRVWDLCHVSGLTIVNRLSLSTCTTLYDRARGM